ncbi:hypothetical protein [Streptomyces mayteni]
MSALPAGVTGAIRIALEFNILFYHEHYKDDLPSCDLYVDIIQALKSVYEVNPQTSVFLAGHALRNVSTPSVVTGEGVPLRAAAECLRHSLTQGNSEEWTDDKAQSFVTAALMAD